MNLTIDFNPPDRVRDILQSESGDLPTAAREAFGVELFRRGMLSHCELGSFLNMDRFETDALLKGHGVTERTLTHADIDEDVNSLNNLISSIRP
jgi:hypothetical protein